ncbi:unnamed protein product [Clonostachys rosea]|uniref:Transcription factor domain-containing protein n=1 Tax=Bionectria ochroleuca TaxID=29856 RepID=A0ABY6TTU2_BIOOC|nr:unnamed protein product [Clonostachys rosea]
MESTSFLPGLHFINTSHPRDATTSDTLREIRSHAAKETRSRAHRSTKKPAAGPRRRLRPRTKVDKSTHDKQGLNKQTCIASKIDRDGESIAPNAIDISTIECFDPYHSAKLSRVAAWWNSVRPFSDVEYFLFDHYINFFIPFSIGSCHRKKNPNLVATQMNYWVPFALTDVGLIAAVFLQSCRSLASLATTKAYDDLSTEYRLQCIRSTNASLSKAESQANDATISKVMILASEEFERGNLEAWNTHFIAISRMVAMRGGVDNLGVGGFMKEILINTPYCYGFSDEGSEQETNPSNV